MHWPLPLDGNEDFPLSYHLGLLGMTGMTAYAGLFEIGRPKEGQTVFVNAAAGAVGQAAVQFAKLCGLNLRVIATAGSDEKLEVLKAMGADVVFNYKTLPKDRGEAEKKMREIAGEKGIDIFFDNVSLQASACRSQEEPWLMEVGDSSFRHTNLSNPLLCYVFKGRRRHARHHHPLDQTKRRGRPMRLGRRLRPDRIGGPVFDVPEPAQLDRHAASNRRVCRV